MEGGAAADGAAKLKTDEEGVVGGGEVIGDAADGENTGGDDDEVESGVKGEAGDAAL